MAAPAPLQSAASPGAGDQRAMRTRCQEIKTESEACFENTPLWFPGPCPGQVATLKKGGIADQPAGAESTVRLRIVGIGHGLAVKDMVRNPTNLNVPTFSNFP